MAVCALALAVACVFALQLAGQPGTVNRAGETPAEPQGIVARAADAIADPQVEDPDIAEALERVALGDDPASYEPGVVLAALAEGATSDEALYELNSLPQLQGIQLAERIGDVLVLSLPAGIAVQDAQPLVASAAAIEHAQPNNRYYVVDDGLAQADATETVARTATAASARLIAGKPLGDALGVQSDEGSARFDDPLIGEQWALDSMSVPDAWDAVEQAGASQVTVAVIDAGFRTTHEDITGNLAAQYDAVTKEDRIYPTNLMQRDLNHGTHCLGVVGAVAGNGKGIAGTAGNFCKTLPVRVQNDNGAIYDSTVVSAYAYLVTNKERYGIRVVNISLGAPSSTPVEGATDNVLYQSIQDAHDAGIVTVAAACNNMTSGGTSWTAPFYSFPSDFPNTVSVINLQKDEGNSDGVRRNSTSNFNVEGQMAKNISAPGTDIKSVWGTSDTSYSLLSGTSMAAPAVASVLGLEFAANPGLSADEAVEILYEAANDLTASTGTQEGWDVQTGYGEVDARDAVKWAIALKDDDPDDSDNPDNPDQPSDPGNPDNPDTPVNPDVPDDPNAPSRDDSASDGSGGSGSSSGGSVAPTPTAPVEKATVYRLYNHNTGEHFFTTGIGEREALRVVGWRYEGVAWVAPLRSLIPVYRLYNPNAGDHHYTVSALERDGLVRAGWREEGAGWCSYEASNGTPLYRLYNPNAVSGAHHYTTSATERDYLVSLGWRAEGVGWRAVPE